MTQPFYQIMTMHSNITKRKEKKEKKNINLAKQPSYNKNQVLSLVIRNLSEEDWLIKP